MDIGDTKFLVHIRLLVGKKYIFDTQGKVNIEKHWTEMPTCYAYQTIVKDITTYCNNVQSYKTVSDIFEPGTVCFMLAHPYYGAMGKVRHIE